MPPEEQEAGSILIDFGGGTTDVLVVLNNAPICAFSIPIGGERVTRDISEYAAIPYATAEELKIKYGCCWKNAIDDDVEIVIPGVGSESSVITTKSSFSKLIQPRVAEILRKICDHLENTINCDLTGSIVLTGGGANLSGIVELTKYIFNFNSVRIGRPQTLGGLEEKYKTPEFATAVGLVLSRGKPTSAVEESTKKVRMKSSSDGTEKPGIFKKVVNLMLGF